MIKHLIFAIFIGIAAFLIYLASYLGVFQSVKISEGEAATFLLLGKDHVGAYHKINEVIQEVETWAKANGVDCSQSFGLYLDDPRVTEEPRLRSFGGCWVSAAPPKLPEGFSIRMWPSTNQFVKAVFDGSPGIGPMKVYPKVEDYIEKKKYNRGTGVLEVYVVHSQKEMTTTYYFPIFK